MMRNIVYISKEFGYTYQEVMEMPHAIFLSYIRWARQFEMESNPEFMEKVEEMKYLEVEEPDLAGLRNFKI